LTIIGFQSSLWWGWINISADIPSHSKSAICFERVNNWLEDCKENHPLCTSLPQRLPSRVLDLGSSSDVCKLLQDSEQIQEYVTLSHCWGTFRDPPGITTKSTISDRLDGILISSLPRTFQDTIFITRALGIRYLWIDSLCIVQDDTDDWERECIKMGSIYRNSFLTLAATASADGSGGMLRERHTSYHNIPIQLAEPGPSVTIGSRPLYTHSTLSSSQEGDPLSRRAWAFQERLLARRILHFTSHELLWECKTKQQCECLGWTASQGDILQGEKLAFEDMAQGSNLESVIVQRNPCFLPTWQQNAMWHNIIQTYSERSLTVEGDSLPAFSAIARLLVKEENWLGGIRRDNIIPDFLWVTVSASCPHTSKYRAPSWSWASKYPGEELVFNQPKYFSWSAVSSPRFSLIDAQCFPAGIDPFGRLSHGYLVIKAPFLEVVTEYHLLSKTSSNEPLSSRSVAYYPDYTDELEGDSLKVRYCVAIWEDTRDSNVNVSFCLVLRKLDSQVEDLYKRTGTCQWVCTFKTPLKTFKIL